MKKNLVFLIFLFISSAASEIHALEKVSIDQALTLQNISRSVEYIEDKEKKIKFADIKDRPASEWEQNVKSDVNFGYTRSQYWFRFSINNTTEQTLDYFLEVDFPPLDLVELYIPDKSGNYQTKKNGDSFPFSNREVLDKNYIFKLKQSPGTSKYYLLVNSLDAFSFNINIFSVDSYMERAHKDLPVFWFYCGLMMAMAFYNLFIYLTVRERNYISFVCFIIALLLLEFNLKGYGSQYLWPDGVWWTNHANPFLVSLTCCFLTLFLLGFVESKSLSPRIYKLCLYAIVIPASILSILSLFLDVQTSLIPVLILTLFVTLALVILGVYLGFIIKPPSRQARIALAAFSLYAIAIPIFILMLIGLLPANFFTRWVLQLGISFAVITLSFGLADKINVMKNIIEKAGKKYRTLVESSKDIIFSLDEDLNILSVNGALKQHLGFKPEEILNTNFLDLIQETWSEKIDVAKESVIEFVNDLKATKEIVQFRTTFTDKYGFEPKELAVRLEYTNLEETGYSFLGKASIVIEDTLLQFLHSESYKYSLNNFLNNAEFISQRLTRNLEKYIDSAELPAIRIALREAIINSIEHGNLNLTFEEKTQAQISETYRKLLQERQEDPKYSNKKVTMEYSLNKKRVVYKLSDEGEGFDYRNHEGNPEVDNDLEVLSHGRGLLMIKSIFDEVHFNDKGNQIMMIKYFKTPEDS